MAKKRKQDEGGGYSWMDTYGDMVTLLLTFFIMLFSMSSVDAEKWEILVKAFSRNKDDNTSQIVMIPEGDGDQTAPAKGESEKLSGDTDTDANAPQDLSQLAQMIQEYIEENDMQDSVAVEEGENSVYLRFDNNLFFDGDSAVLRPSSYEILDFLGNMFKVLESQILVIRVNGHTAAIPGNNNYAVNDWDLSSNRANRVVSYFEERSKIDPMKLMTNGWGKNHPIADNNTAEGQAKNRRVDIMILGNNFDTTDADELYSMLQKVLDVNLVDDTPLEEEPEITIDPAADPAAGDVTAPGEGDGAMEDQPAEPAPPVAEPDPEELQAALDLLKAQAEQPPEEQTPQP